MDIGILYFIQEHLRSDIWTGFFRFITSLGDSGWCWILIAVILMIFKKTRETGLQTACSLGTGFLITNVLLKNLIRRTRPYDAYDFLVPLIEHPSDYSFPSGHTCASFAAAFVLFKAFPRRFSWLFLMLAALIAFSRLYLGVHYPTDILGGFAVGLLSAYISELIMKKTKKIQ